ncbi:MAG: pyrroline-5-carboxylate reductase [Halobacteriaceae archaeon]
MVRVSVIGCGNMGSALLKGLAAAGGHELVACDQDPHALESVSEYVSKTTADAAEATADAEVVVVAVKPDVVPYVLDDLNLDPSQTLVTIAAGVSTDFVEPRTDADVVRVMPNLAAETRNMAAAATGDVNDAVRTLLDDAGEFVEIEEERMDVATAVNGSGPAFVFYLIQAMRDAGVDAGLDPGQAETLAAQTFKGAAETVLQSEQSIEDLIDAVCSPNGTTIEGMEVLWDSDADDAVAAAVAAAEERSRELAEGVGDE